MIEWKLEVQQADGMNGNACASGTLHGSRDDLQVVFVNSSLMIMSEVNSQGSSSSTPQKDNLVKTGQKLVPYLGQEVASAWFSNTNGSWPNLKADD
jgi:hypothetical protein